MKVTLAVWTKVGFYAQREAECRMLKHGLEKVVPLLEEMPTEIDGEKQHEWTRIQIEVTRD